MIKVTSWKNKTAKKDHLQALMKDETSEPIAYDKNDNFEVGDYLNHEKFGFGFVQKVISRTKMEVFFEDSEKVMLQNWQ